MALGAVNTRTRDRADLWTLTVVHDLHFGHGSCGSAGVVVGRVRRAGGVDLVGRDPAVWAAALN